MHSFVSNIIYVAAGGALGAVLRYCVSVIFSGTHSFIPIPTLFVNITGSFLMGLLFTCFSIFYTPSHTRLLLLVGLLGGYTTFSTFAFDSSALLLKGDWVPFVLNLLCNNVGSILAAIGGVYLGKFIFQ